MAQTEITVRTTITGLVNGQVFNGTVEALLNPDGGGRSSCQFSDLPDDFFPGTFATHT